MNFEKKKCEFKKMWILKKMNLTKMKKKYIVKFCKENVIFEKKNVLTYRKKCEFWKKMWIWKKIVNFDHGFENFKIHSFIFYFKQNLARFARNWRLVLGWIWNIYLVCLLMLVVFSLKKKEDNTLWCFMLRFESPEIQNHFC